MAEIELTPEHAADPNTRLVGILVGIVGILLSVVTIASHRAHTEAIIHRTESNDQWSLYQAKKIREYTSDAALTLLGALTPDAAKTEATAQKLAATKDKYAKDAEEIMKEARAKDAEQHIEERRALFFDIGEGLLELGLVLCSLYFLARKIFFPAFGILASIAGTVLGIWGLGALRSLRRRVYGLIALTLLTGAVVSGRAHAADAPAAAPARVEAKSETTLAVAVVKDDRMTIHLSRVLDNAPIRDAVLTVLLRGVVHPTVAEADGSYTLQSSDLKLPGSAAVEFHIVQGAAREDLKGTLQLSAGEQKPGEPNSARQLGWWVLNFAVCIGFVMLWSRRRKNTAES